MMIFPQNSTLCVCKFHHLQRQTRLQYRTPSRRVAESPKTRKADVSALVPSEYTPLVPLLGDREDL